MDHTIENDGFIAVISDHAATLERLYNKKTGREHIWSYDPEFWPRRTSICFPMMALLLDGKTIMEGSERSFENHGFLREMDMEVTNASPDSVEFTVGANDVTRVNYPYEFEFRAIYSLDAEGLSIEYVIGNNGKNVMPYCVAAHTTFKVPIGDGESMTDDILIRFEKPETASVHAARDGFLTHEMLPVLDGTDTLRVRGLFDNGALIFDTKDLVSRRVSIESERSPYSTTLDFTGFSNLILWSKPGEMPFLCMEPSNGLTDFADADGIFEHKPFVQLLQPGEKRSHIQKIIAK